MDTNKRFFPPAYPCRLDFFENREKSIFKNIKRSFLNKVIQKIASRSIDKTYRKNIQFKSIETIEEWTELLHFRLENYGKTIPYILSELDKHGSDFYDNHSFAFGVWHKKKLVASIRYTTWPFEMSNLLDTEKLGRAINTIDDKEYLELSRLLLKPKLKIKGLLTGLIIYSGLAICVNTQYRKYIGYTKTATYKRLSGFECNPSEFQFSIPKRGDHKYSILKGDFEKDFIKVINRILPFCCGSFLAKMFFR